MNGRPTPSPWPPALSDRVARRVAGLSNQDLAGHGLQGFADDGQGGWIAQSLAFDRELARIGQEWTRRGIRFLVLKGGALRRWLYPQPVTRAMSDIDVLVARADVAAASAALESLGYRSAIRGAGNLIFMAHQFLRQLGSLQLPLDLHWELGSPPVLRGRFDFEGLWKCRVDLGDGLAGLSPTHALWHAAMHRAALSVEHRSRLVWLLDVHLLWRSLDEHGRENAVEGAIEAGIAGILHDAMVASRHAWETDIHPDHRQRLDEAAPDQPASMLLHRNRGIDALIFDLRHLPDHKTRFGFLMQLAFPPRAYMAHSFGPGPLPWRYFRRGWRGLRKLFR